MTTENPQMPLTSDQQSKIKIRTPFWILWRPTLPLASDQGQRESLTAYARDHLGLSTIKSRLALTITDYDDHPHQRHQHAL